jgi:hypothetical protein
MLADMASPRVKARGTAGTGPPEDIAIGNGITLDATSLRTAQQMSITVDGSGLKLSGDATSPGNSQYYGTNSGGTKGFFALPAGGGLTLITSVAAGAGTTVTVTGLGGYKMFFVVMRGVSHNSGVAQAFRVELSGNAGSTWGTPLSPNGGTGFAAAVLVSGWFMISRIDQTNNQLAAVSTMAGLTSEDTSSRGPIDALRFSFAAGNFDAGNFDIYGLK